MNKNNEVKEVMLKTLYSTQHETFRMILDKELKHFRSFFSMLHTLMMTGGGSCNGIENGWARIKHME